MKLMNSRRQNKMENQTPEIILDQKDFDVIANYLEVRLSQFRVHAYDFVWKATPKYTYKYVGELKLDKAVLGIFSHAMKMVELDVEIWGNEEVRTVSTHLSYEHIGGGTNGCDMDVTLKYNCREKKLFEVSK